MKKSILISVIIIGSLSGKSQQMAHFSQYLLNDFFLNPATAGTKDYSPIRLTVRSQWAGFEDAPKTQTLSFHSNAIPGMGFGGVIINDKTGPLGQTGLELAYAYHLEVSKSTKLSLGLSAKAVQYALDESKITLEESNDFTFSGTTSKTLVPDAGFGTYLYSEKYFVGLSVPQLFQTKVKYDAQDEKLNKEVRHYYLFGGYNFEINKDFMVTPSMLVKTVFTAPTQFDVNIKGTYRDIVSLGVSYRLKDAVVILVGLEKEKFTFGYAYDITLTNIRKYSTGSHEVMLGMNIEDSKKNKGRKRYSPRMR